VVAVDPGDVDSIRAALTGAQKAFSLSPLDSDYAAPFGINFVEAAKQAGIEHIVRASALGAGMAQPITMNTWHREVEQAVEASGIPYTVVRPNYFMQNYVSVAAPTVRAQNAFYLPHGDGAISSIDVRDVGEVVATVLTERGHEGMVYDLTGAEALSHHDAARILSRLTGRTIAYLAVPDDAARQGMREMGLAPDIIEGLLELARVIREGGYPSEVHPAVEQVTGRRPRSFERFAKDHLEFFDAAAEAA
jgi:uncharacterized protein YbjT (DUF2867 family)